MTIRIHIDRLVLNGFTLQPGESSQVRAALELELTRLVGAENAQSFLSTKHNPSLQDAAVASVDGGPFNSRQGESPRHLGTHIARSVYGGMERMR